MVHRRSFKDKRPAFIPKSFRYPLWVLLAIPFVALLCLVAGGVTWFSMREGRLATEQVAQRLRTEIAQRTHDYVNDLLRVVPVLHRINAVEVQHMDAQGTWPLAAVEQHFYQQMKTWPFISRMTLHSKTGAMISLLRTQEGDWFWHEIQPEDLTAIAVYSVTESGQQGELQEILPQPPRLLADQQYENRHMQWTAAHPSEHSGCLSIESTYSVFDENQRFLGRLEIEIALRDITQYLQTLDVGETGLAFLMDPAGRLLAASTPTPCLHMAGKTLSQVNATASQVPLIGTVAQELDQIDLQRSQTLQFRHQGQRISAAVLPVQDAYGLNWVLVVVLPEAEYMAPLNQRSRLTVIFSVIAVIAGIAISLLIARRLTRPIQSITRAAKKLASGHWQHRVPTSCAVELHDLSQSFAQMAQDLQNSFQALEHKAYHDDLTGLPNRHLLTQRIEQAIAYSITNPDFQFALILVDIDGFKLINEGLGHLTGDHLLIQVANRLQAILKNGNCDIVSRLGSDEFVLLRGNIQDISEAVKLAETAKQHLQSPFYIEGQQVFINASLSIVPSRRDNTSATQYLQEAGTALSIAKKTGKGHYQIFDISMQAIAQNRLQLETDLHWALEHREFQVFYQPIVNIQTNTIAGFEALVRWHHPKHGYLPPDQFIPILEETGLIVPVGRWILKTACQQMQQWRQKFPALTDSYIAVNLSVRQFVTPQLLDQIQKILWETHLPPHCLRLEITESLLLSKNESIIEKMNDLRSLEIGLSLDDFGIGYSSLSYLQSFPFDVVKIDRSFIENIVDNPRKQSFVEAIVVLANSLQMTPILEGIENKLQLDLLRQMNCPYMQGFYFSRALSATAAARWITQRYRQFVMEKR